MSREQEFDIRISSIYRLGNPKLPSEAKAIDTRHEEFQAMTDVFLGKDYDQNKLKQVEKFQIFLQKKRALLHEDFKENKLSPVQYVNQFNALLYNTFYECEKILGEDDFLRLFGAPREELGGFIDEDIFVATQNENDHRNSGVDFYR